MLAKAAPAAMVGASRPPRFSSRDVARSSRSAPIGSRAGSRESRPVVHEPGFTPQRRRDSHEEVPIFHGERHSTRSKAAWS